MPHEDINKLISTSTALLSAGSVNLWEHDEKGEAKATAMEVKFKITAYARHQKQYVWSAIISQPNIRYKIAEEPGFIIDAAPEELVKRVFNLWGAPQFRSEVSARDDYYLADDKDTDVTAARKARYTAFYYEEPIIDVPPFYTLENSEGHAMGTWGIQTRCYDLDRYNVCNACRASMVDVEEGEAHEGDCLRVGNFLPSSRRSVQRRKYNNKKKQVSLREAIKMGVTGKRPRDLTPQKPPNKKNYTSTSTDELEEGEMELDDLDQVIAEITS